MPLVYNVLQDRHLAFQSSTTFSQKKLVNKIVADIMTDGWLTYSILYWIFDSFRSKCCPITLLDHFYGYWISCGFTSSINLRFNSWRFADFMILLEIQYVRRKLLGLQKYRIHRQCASNKLNGIDKWPLSERVNEKSNVKLFITHNSTTYVPSTHYQMNK